MVGCLQLIECIGNSTSRRARRRKNGIIAGLLGLVLFLAFLTWYAFNQQSTADKERRKAQVLRVTVRPVRGPNSFKGLKRAIAQ